MKPCLAVALRLLAMHPARATMRLLIIIALTTLLLPLSTGNRDGGDLVNAVLGNSTSIGPSTNEVTRIRVHLSAVVERLAANDRDAQPELRAARQKNIARLVEYARAGRFPHKPTSMPGRVPNFLDDRGAVCAVGYLVEQDLGREAVATIARDHQFDYVPYIDSPVLSRWQATSGLSELELAMIQPTYGEPPVKDFDEGSFSNEDAVIITLAVADVVSSVFNFTYLAEGKGNRLWGAVGLFIGGMSILVDQTVDDSSHYLTASGILAAAFGATSFGLTFRSADRKTHAALEPLLRGSTSSAPEIGIQARVCF